MSAEGLNISSKDIFRASALVTATAIAMGAVSESNADNIFNEISDLQEEGYKAIAAQGILINNNASNALVGLEGTRISFTEFTNLTQGADPDSFSGIADLEAGFSNPGGLRDTFRLGDADFGVFIVKDQSGLMFAVPDIRAHDVDPNGNENRTSLILPFQDGRDTRLLIIDDLDGSGDVVRLTYDIDPATGNAYPIRITEFEDGTEFAELMVVDKDNNEQLIQVEDKDVVQSMVGQVKDGISLNVRSGPSTDYGKLTSLPKGTTFMILGEENGWYRIYARSANPQLGWVSGDFIELLEDQPQPSPVPPAPETDVPDQLTDIQPEFFETMIDLPDSPQIKDINNRYMAFYSDAYLQQEAHVAAIHIPEDEATMATDLIYSTILEYLNMQLQKDGEPTTSFDDELSLKTVYYTDMTKRDKKDISGKIDGIKHFVVTWEELKAIKNSIDLDSDEFLELNSGDSKTGRTSNINRGLAYFNENTLVLVTAPNYSFSSKGRSVYEVWNVVQDGPASAMVMLRDAITAGEAGIALGEAPNSDEIYRALGCNEGNGWCDASSPVITLTPAN